MAKRAPLAMPQTSKSTQGVREHRVVMDQPPAVRLISPFPWTTSRGGTFPE